MKKGLNIIHLNTVLLVVILVLMLYCCCCMKHKENYFSNSNKPHLHDTLNHAHLE